jgi:hypothetical protein
MKALSNRLFLALTLCTGDGPIKARLAQAWIDQLDEINPAELPRSICKDFIALRKAIYAETPLPTEHAAQASVRKMSTKQAVEHARTITTMFRTLATTTEPSIEIAHNTASGGKAGIHFEQDNSQHLN